MSIPGADSIFGWRRTAWTPESGAICAGWCCKNRRRSKPRQEKCSAISPRICSHQLWMRSSLRSYWLVSSSAEANEQLAIGDHRFRAGELIAFGWPVADKLHAPRSPACHAACRARQGTIRRSPADRPCRTARRSFPRGSGCPADPRPLPSLPEFRRNPEVGMPRISTSYWLISAGESSFRLCSVTSSGPMISRIFSAAISV